jgi:hypothetical protein
MEQIITLKVDLEYPEEAHHAIDEAVKSYEEDKLKWAEAEVLEAQNSAMRIMSRLCLDGYSISWHEIESYGIHSIGVFIELVKGKKTNCTCSISTSKWNLWIAKCVCLCRATGMDVPDFIVKKAGECW